MRPSWVALAMLSLLTLVACGATTPAPERGDAIQNATESSRFWVTQDLSYKESGEAKSAGYLYSCGLSSDDPCNQIVKGEQLFLDTTWANDLLYAGMNSKGEIRKCDDGGCSEFAVTDGAEAGTSVTAVAEVVDKGYLVATAQDADSPDSFSLNQCSLSDQTCRVLSETSDVSTVRHMVATPSHHAWIGDATGKITKCSTHAQGDCELVHDPKSDSAIVGLTFDGESTLWAVHANGQVLRCDGQATGNTCTDDRIISGNVTAMTHDSRESRLVAAIEDPILPTTSIVTCPLDPKLDCHNHEETANYGVGESVAVTEDGTILTLDSTPPSIVTLDKGGNVSILPLGPLAGNTRGTILIP